MSEPAAGKRDRDQKGQALTTRAARRVPKRKSVGEMSDATELRKPKEHSELLGERMKQHNAWLVACVVTSTLAFNLSLTFLAPFFPALALAHGDDGMQNWLSMVVFIAEPGATLVIGLSCATWLLLRFGPLTIVIVSAVLLFASLSAGTLLSLTTRPSAFVTLAVSVRIVSGIGCSLGQMAGTALLMQNLPDSTLPDAIGLNEAAVGIAFIAGPLIGGSYDGIWASMNVPCWPFLIVGSISAIAGCSFICLPRSAISMVTGATPVSPLHLISVQGVTRGVVLIAYSVVVSTCLEPQLEIWLNAPPFQLPNLMVGAIFASGLLGYAPGAIFARRVQDTFGLEWTLASGCLANFIGLTLLAVAAPLETMKQSAGTVVVFAAIVIASAGSGPPPSATTQLLKRSNFGNCFRYSAPCLPCSRPWLTPSP